MEDLNWRTRCYSLQDINNQLERQLQQYKQQIDEAIKFLNEYTISEPLNEVSSGLFISGMEEPEFLWKLYNILSKLKEKDVE